MGAMPLSLTARSCALLTFGIGRAGSDSHGKMSGLSGLRSIVGLGLLLPPSSDPPVRVSLRSFHTSFGMRSGILLNC